MKRNLVFIAIVFLLITACSKKDDPKPLVGDRDYPTIIDHTSINLSLIPDKWIEQAKTDLHIGYGHTSHGSQITDGMRGLVSFKGNKYAWNNGGTGGALDLHDNAMSGDLGNPNLTQWEKETRSYLNANKDVNVIIWSWCGQVSSATEAQINTYLSLMSGLEVDFPKVFFVYMTGHLDGTGLKGNLHKRNEQIRTYCKTNNKYLFDFADIESYDPDGKYYLDKSANDGCDYDSDNNGSLDSNWATKWQNANAEGIDWYTCGSAHSQPLNANMKAYAAWNLWARIAGWDGK